MGGLVPRPPPDFLFLFFLSCCEKKLGGGLEMRIGGRRGGERVLILPSVHAGVAEHLGSLN